jgi:hypothetical protein
LTDVTRQGDLFGLSAIIADLIEGNLTSEPERKRLLEGKAKLIRITATDLDASVSLVLGEGTVQISEGEGPDPDVWIVADSLTLLDLPNAKLLGGLPSIADTTGRAVVGKILSGKLKIRGILRVGTVRRVQMLLSVA